MSDIENNEHQRARIRHIDDHDWVVSS